MLDGLAGAPGRSAEACGVLLGAFEDPPWIVQAFGAIIGIALLIALIAWIVFALVDLARRSDIGRVKKSLWLVAFLLSGGIVWAVYGAVRFSSTNGTPGG